MVKGLDAFREVCFDADGGHRPDADAPVSAGEGDPAADALGDPLVCAWEIDPTGDQIFCNDVLPMEHWLAEAPQQSGIRVVSHPDTDMPVVAGECGPPADATGDGRMRPMDKADLPGDQPVSDDVPPHPSRPESPQQPGFLVATAASADVLSANEGRGVKRKRSEEVMIIDGRTGIAQCKEKVRGLVHDPRDPVTNVEFIGFKNMQEIGDLFRCFPVEVSEAIKFISLNGVLALIELISMNKFKGLIGIDLSSTKSRGAWNIKRLIGRVANSAELKALNLGGMFDNLRLGEGNLPCLGRFKCLESLNLARLAAII